MHMIFSGSSKGSNTAPGEISSFNYIYFMLSLYAPYYTHKAFRAPCYCTPGYEACMVYSFHRFNHRISICLCIFVVFRSPESKAHG